ncbi:MAG: iron-containing alcohol dehydrogenase [Eubacteriales bacterium]
MNYQKYNNTNYILGEGSINYIREYKDKRIALVIDNRVIEALNLKDKLFNEILKDCDYRLICNIDKEPSIDMLDPYISKIQKYNPDIIVAIGGGATIDAGKVLWLFSELPKYTWDKVFSPNEIESFTGKVSLIAIPTTSGTGSETTSAAVVKDKDKRKRLILTDEIIPTIAILDFDLLKSLPSRVVIYSGIDALAHAIESAVSKIASPFVEMNSICAAVEIIENLQKSVEGNQESREKMHIAATIAGMGINNSITGMAHGTDYAGGDFNLPHGLVTGMLLPYTMEYLIPQPVYEKIATRLGLQGNYIEKQKELVNMIFNIYNKIEMPICFKEIAIDERSYLNHIDEYVKLAIKDPNNLLAPKEVTENALKELFLKYYYGKKE